MVMETTGTGSAIKARYLRGTSLIAQQIDGTLWYYTHNAHGDVVQRTRHNGSATPQYQYGAFGNQREPAAKDPNPFRYCGEYWDAELGEVYLRARTYNPANGRFSTEDPARSGSNWYGYCGGNPVAHIDPSGLTYKNNSKAKIKAERNAAAQKAAYAWAAAQAKITAAHSNGNSATLAQYELAFNLGMQFINKYPNSSIASYIQKHIISPSPAIYTNSNMNPYFSNMIFAGDNRIEVSHGRYGSAAQLGRRFNHYALDISTTSSVPIIHSTISGTVVYAGYTHDEGRGLTHEWGWHVRILDEQGNLHIFAHCDRLLIPEVTSSAESYDITAGQAIAIMGDSGNAGPGSGQGPHVHYEVRNSNGGPENAMLWAGIPNEVGSWYLPK